MNVHHHSLLSLVKATERETTKGKLNQALKLIHDGVLQVTTEPVCTAQVLASPTLDGLCQKIGQICLQRGSGSDAKEVTETNKPVVVYLVTKLQSSGGHTRVIRDFIMARPEVEHIVFSTELDGCSDKKFLFESIPANIRLRIECAPKGNFETKLIWLQAQLLHYPQQKVYLFNHHQDSVIIAAIQPEMALTVSFYHHGDHHLCLGASLSDCEHIDIHAMGYHQCRSTGIDNIYIPLVVADKGERTQDQPFKQQGCLTSCTAARSNKIEKPYFIQYTEVIPELLARTKGKHIHIGTLSPWARWKIKRELKQRGVPSGRFVYIPWVSDVWRTLQQMQVDVYIASFPYGGGLTLIEAMGSGIPIATHRHTYSRTLSGIDLAYPGVFNWHFPDELIDYCANVTEDELKQHSLSGRQHYTRHYQSDYLAQILNNKLRIPAPELWSHYQPEYDEFTYWLSGQFTLYHVLFQKAYRLAKKLKSLR